MDDSGKVALIGAGLVGRGWAIVFARAGREVALFDADRAALDAALPAGSHAEAERGAAYVQESEREDPASESPIEDAGRRAAPARQAANARIIVDSQGVEVFEKRLAG